MKTPLFEKAKKYSQRIIDCIETLKLMPSTFYKIHNGSFHYQNERKGIIILDKGKIPFNDRIFVYYPEYLKIYNPENLTQIKNTIPVLDFSEEVEFQFSTLYNNEELLMQYICSILWNFDIKGHIYINPKMDLRTYTLALKNINDYAYEHFNYIYHEKIEKMNFKSRGVRYL